LLYNMKTTYATYAALICLAQAESWGYQQWGADWPALRIDNNKCGGLNQSPIDLKTQDQTILLPSEDNFQKLYTN
jgi:carbonic anhydrase